MRRRRSIAFTLIELVFGIVLISVVLMAAGSMLVRTTWASEAHNAEALLRVERHRLLASLRQDLAGAVRVVPSEGNQAFLLEIASVSRQPDLVLYECVERGDGRILARTEIPGGDGQEASSQCRVARGVESCRVLPCDRTWQVRIAWRGDAEQESLLEVARRVEVQR